MMSDKKPCESLFYNVYLHIFSLYTLYIYICILHVQGVCKGWNQTCITCRVSKKKFL